MAKSRKTQRSKKPSKSKKTQNVPFGFQTRAWIQGARILTDKKSTWSEGTGLIIYEPREKSSGRSSSSTSLKKYLSPWQLKNLEKSQEEVNFFTGSKGPVAILRPNHPGKGPKSHAGILDRAPYAAARDLVGGIWPLMKAGKAEEVRFVFDGTEEEAIGALVGLELAEYRFRAHYDQAPDKGPSLTLIESNSVDWKTVLEGAAALASGTNLTRHLVNLPAADLNPATFAEGLRRLFAGVAHMKVEVWDEARLKREKMGLHLGVGKGSSTPPCLVHIRYRPKAGSRRGASARKPIAFVGKGVTFDTGGLDLKPSQAMRLMKKDMGGAAALAGLAFWVGQTQPDRACDFYFGLAENSVSGPSFRPGDILVSRQGISVEIHNTDAEGRLVLADALDVAVTQKGVDEPAMVINVATLTGAVKVALGSVVAGMFANEDGLADELLRCGYESGDRSWRMPLVPEMRVQLRTPVADLVNSSDGFGGAVNAALFLERFVQNKPWAHFDIYAWQDKPGGALTEPGGSGQMVQCLARFVSVESAT